MRLFGNLPVLCLFFGLFALPLAADDPTASAAVSSGSSNDVLDFVEVKRMEVNRLENLVESGSMPRARLDQAQAELEDARDNMILRRTLYGMVRLEDFTTDQADEMVAAAERLVARQEERYEHSKSLVEEGVLARVTLSALLEDLSFRRKALDLARYRANLVAELSEQAEAEGELDADIQFGPRRVIERFDGSARFGEVEFAKLSVAFQMRFSRALPVSAKGGTALHRALGFDHRGRVDVALNPDQPEGMWLRSYLKKSGIPYYAFRAAVRGKSTAPHIHIGPPSLRLRNAD